MSLCSVAASQLGNDGRYRTRAQKLVQVFISMSKDAIMSENESQEMVLIDGTRYRIECLLELKAQEGTSKQMRVLFVCDGDDTM